MNLKPPMKTNRTFRLFLLIMMPMAVFAQDRQQDRKDKIETMHIAYLSEKLNLTSGEAEKFWPVYNEYKTEQDKLRKQRMDNVQAVIKANGVDNMSDADVQKLITDETDLETRQLDLRKVYITKFQQAIPIRKVAKFFIAEDEFKRYLLNQLRKRREQNGRGMGDDDIGSH